MLEACDAAVEGTVGELTQELTGELAVEHVGDAVKGLRLLHRNAPAASSSAAFSCTHSGSMRERKGLLEF